MADALAPELGEENAATLVGCDFQVTNLGTTRLEEKQEHGAKHVAFRLTEKIKVEEEFVALKSS